MSQTESKHSFWRQSGWMLIATVIGGVFMYAVHIIAKKMPKAEYGVFTTLLQILNLMGIPAAGLQTVFVQQAAAALTDEKKQLLSAAFRGVVRGVFVVWLIMAVIVITFQSQFIAALQIANPAALWVTIVLGLAALFLPIVTGLLQGTQNFLWMGWSSILNGVGRFTATAVIVLLLGGYAAGGMVAALIGIVAAVGIGFWQNYSLWAGARSRFEWGPWLKRVIPLTLGLGCGTFMMSADMILVQNTFDRDHTGYYAAAGMIGRALVFFTVPLSAVMFPKLVRSAATAQKTNVLGQALGATAILGATAALGCTLFPSLPLRIVYDSSFLVISPLVPWFAWCMVPLTLANVLMNNLMAKERFHAVPWMLLVTAGYGITLFCLKKSLLAVDQMQAFKMVVQTLGLFSLIQFGITGWFSWDRQRAS